MEGSGLVVVILIVTVSDKKCSSFSSILIAQLCNTLTGLTPLERAIKKKKMKGKRNMCERVGEKVSGKREKEKRGLGGGRQRETKRDK